MEQVLLFRIGEQPYGLEVANLQEIVETPPLFFIPMAPPCFSGAMNFHGQILPVLDLPGFLGQNDGRRDRRVIVLAAHLCAMAFTTTSVQRIVSLDADAMTPYQSMGDSNELIRCRFDREGEMINILDAAGLVAGLERFSQRRK
ncbi:MAG: chemotaxis protein CheW [Desulfuromonadales bacterium]